MFCLNHLEGRQPPLLSTCFLQYLGFPACNHSYSCKRVGSHYAYCLWCNVVTVISNYHLLYTYTHLQMQTQAYFKHLWIVQILSNLGFFLNSILFLAVFLQDHTLVTSSWSRTWCPKGASLANKGHPVKFNRHLMLICWMMLHKFCPFTKRSFA